MQHAVPLNHQAHQWPVGLMDKASASGAGDSRFESWAGHIEDSPYSASAPPKHEAVEHASTLRQQGLGCAFHKQPAAAEFVAGPAEASMAAHGRLGVF